MGRFLGPFVRLLTLASIVQVAILLVFAGLPGTPFGIECKRNEDVDGKPYVDPAPNYCFPDWAPAGWAEFQDKCRFPELQNTVLVTFFLIVFQILLGQIARKYSKPPAWLYTPEEVTTGQLSKLLRLMGP